MNRLTVIEGPDGSGKSTLLRQMEQRMNERGLVVETGRQPGATPAGEKVREILLDPTLEMDALSQFYLFMASRTAFLEQVVRPALLERRSVLCDRLDLSTIFYQTVEMKHSLIETDGLSTNTAKQVVAFHKKINEISRESAEDLPVRYVLMDADDDVLDERRPTNAGDRFESRDRAFQKDMRNFYRQFSGANQSNPNVWRINSNRPVSSQTLDALIDWALEEEVVCPTKLRA